MNTPETHSNGLHWFTALAHASIRAGSPPAFQAGARAPAAGPPRTVLSIDAPLDTARVDAERARLIVVVPDSANRFPRARHGEVGLDEAWSLARYVRETMAQDAGRTPRPIIAIVDVASQAYGRREELLGIHLACAAAADAYASARLAGHPVVALLVGKAMSGAFLAHGYQANRILALDSPDVMVHAMGKQAAARVTRRSVEEIEALGKCNPPMAYDVGTYAQLGLLHRLITGVNAAAPSSNDIHRVRQALIAAVEDIRAHGRDLSCRLTNPDARRTRAASISVRQRLAEQWRAD